MSMIRALQEYQGDSDDEQGYEEWQQRREEAEAAGYREPDPETIQVRAPGALQAFAGLASGRQSRLVCWLTRKGSCRAGALEAESGALQLRSGPPRERKVKSFRLQ